MESSRRDRRQQQQTETLDAAFRKRFFTLSADAQEPSSSTSAHHNEGRLTLRKSTLRALEQRRNSIFGTIDKKRVSAPLNSHGSGCYRSSPTNQPPPPLCLLAAGCPSGDRHSAASTAYLRGALGAHLREPLRAQISRRIANRNFSFIHRLTSIEY